MKQVLCLVITCFALPTSVLAFIDFNPTLGKIIGDSTNIVLLQVHKVNREKHAIIFKKVADLKGKHNREEIKIQMSNGWTPRNLKIVMDWAEPGKTAILFTNGQFGYTCIGSYWYDCTKASNDWWTSSAGRPELSWAYAGSTAKLCDCVATILAGQEVVIPVREHRYAKLAEDRQFRTLVFVKGLVDEREFPIVRIKASLKMPALTCQAKAIGTGPVGPEEIPALIEALQRGHKAERTEAADDLGSLGRKGKAAVLALSLALEDPDALVRVGAAKALAKIDPAQPASVLILIKALHLKDATIRRAAAQALGELGPQAKTAVPALVDSLQDTDAPVRPTVAEALGRIGPAAKHSVSALVKSLEDKDLDLRYAAAEALGGIGDKTELVVSGLLKELKDQDPAVQRVSALALVRLNTQINVAARVFVERLKDPTDPSTNWILGGIASDAVPALWEGLGSRNTVIRQGVCDILKHVQWAKVTSADRNEAINALTKALKDEDNQVRSGAADALKKIQDR